MTQEVSFKVTLTSDPKLPFRTLSVQEDTEFTNVVHFVAEDFGMIPSDAAIITNSMYFLFSYMIV
jgi:ubiquitin-fold modifier 1